MRYKVGEVLMMLHGLLRPSPTAAPTRCIPEYSRMPTGDQLSHVCHMTPFANSFLLSGFSSLEAPYPYPPSSSLLHKFYAPNSAHHDTIPHRHPIPARHPEKLLQQLSLHLILLSHFLCMSIQGSYYTALNIGLCVFQPRLSQNNGSHSGCLIKSTRELLKIKPITISWKKTHKSPKLPK